MGIDKTLSTHSAIIVIVVIAFIVIGIAIYIHKTNQR